MGEVEQVLERRVDDVAESDAGVLADLPQADADLISTVRYAEQGAPLLELADQPVNRRQGHVGLGGDVAQRDRAGIVLEHFQDREHSRRRGPAGFPGSTCHVEPPSESRAPRTQILLHRADRHYLAPEEMGEPGSAVGLRSCRCGAARTAGPAASS
ncbi:hypothetical protein P9209_10925 [Prescottella defluvii]|nr:hypothetical protein P9209_10925 [Prescottella defluvii]